MAAAGDPLPRLAQLCHVEVLARRLRGFDPLDDRRDSTGIGPQAVGEIGRLSPAARIPRDLRRNQSGQHRRARASARGHRAVNCSFGTPTQNSSRRTSIVGSRTSMPWAAPRSCHHAPIGSKPGMRPPSCRPRSLARVTRGECPSHSQGWTASRRPTRAANDGCIRDSRQWGSRPGSRRIHSTGQVPPGERERQPVPGRPRPAVPARARQVPVAGR